MKRTIDIEAILAPIPGDNPAGEDLRYSPIYDQIKEARRADDPFDRGDWQREIKTSDWAAVIKISADALINKTKDLQIAAWFAEALVNTEGFSGLATGLKVLIGFLRDYWEQLYPVIEEEDLDFRVGPIEFLNEKLGLTVKGIPLTDERVTSGYSWLQWQESRHVGYETDTRNQYGDVDESKKQARDELIGEGKVTAEDFDAAVTRSSKGYYESLAQDLAACLEAFNTLDRTVDEKFGADAPRLAELKEALEDCERVIGKILKEKKEREPDFEPEAQIAPGHLEEGAGEEEFPPSAISEGATMTFQGSDSESREKAIWDSALNILKVGDIKKALGQLLSAACAAPSVRERHRYRLLMAKLCLKAGRPDLARPIVEELHVFINELNLERWESPLWIAEVLDALYQCLTSGEPMDDDMQRARELFRKLCTTDVTKAMIYRG